MKQQTFDHHCVDSQGTRVTAMAPSTFDIARYTHYESDLLERNRTFWDAPSGVLVYRRFRVPSVFSYDCRDMERSLALQLGALWESMRYEADIPNFLEPWYGIGTVASAYGISYFWEAGQAPATRAPFSSVQDALTYKPLPVEETSIGKQTLRMIEYFLERTQGKLPISLTDTQSPMNIASYLVETNNFYMGLLDRPECAKQLLAVITDLLIAFSKKQQALIGDSLVLPGHGFSSSRMFQGLGMSDDTMVMLSPRQYTTFEAPCMQKVAEAFGGAAFHSCGDWSRKINAVKKIKNLVMVDGAFSSETDPSPNPPEAFAEAFAGSEVIVNARIVGGPEVVVNIVKRLWTPGMKLIVVTYCQTPQEQHEVYQRVHEVCS